MLYILYGKVLDQPTLQLSLLRTQDAASAANIRTQLARGRRRKENENKNCNSIDSKITSKRLCLK